MNTSQTPYGAQLNIYKKNHISNVLTFDQSEFTARIYSQKN